MATNDWDYVSTYWTLDGSTYVAAPSCVAFYAPQSGTYRTVALNADSNCEDLPEGRLITSIWFGSGYSNPEVWFRNQSAIGSPACTYGYFVKFDYNADDIELWYVNGGADTYIGDFGGYNFPFRSWTKWRITWLTISGQLNVSVDRWTGSAWTNMSPDVNDSNNRWETSGINRCGVGATVTLGILSNGCKFDETSIYA